MCGLACRQPSFVYDVAESPEIVSAMQTFRKRIILRMIVIHHFIEALVGASGLLHSAVLGEFGLQFSAAHGPGHVVEEHAGPEAPQD